MQVAAGIPTAPLLCVAVAQRPLRSVTHSTHTHSHSPHMLVTPMYILALTHMHSRVPHTHTLSLILASSHAHAHRPLLCRAALWSEVPSVLCLFLISPYCVQ